MSTSTAEALSPEDQLRDMLGLLKPALAQKQHTKVFQLRQKIKTHCAKHGIPVPSEAMPYQKGAKGPGPRVITLPMASNREAQPLKVKPQPKTGPDREEELVAVRGTRAKIRLMRLEAWKLIETVQDLPMDDLQTLVEDLRYIALGATTALNVVKIRLGRS